MDFSKNLCQKFEATISISAEDVPAHLHVDLFVAFLCGIFSAAHEYVKIHHTFS